MAKVKKFSGTRSCPEDGHGVAFAASPTKPRIKALLLHQGLLSPYYPVRAVIAIGIAMTVCGVTLTIFGSVAYIIEASAASLCSGVWIGVLVIGGGLVAVYAGNRPASSFLLHVNLFVAIQTLAATGFMTILTANCVVRDSEVTTTASESLQITEPGGDTLDINVFESSGGQRGSPAFMVNSLLLVTSSLSAILSLANFCLTAREACQCYGHAQAARASGVLGLNDPLAGIGLGLDTVQRRDRIIAWILQQTTEPAVSECPSPLPPPVPQPRPSTTKAKLKPIHSNASTASTRLSAYEV